MDAMLLVDFVAWLTAGSCHDWAYRGAWLGPLPKRTVSRQVAVAEPATPRLAPSPTNRPALPVAQPQPTTSGSCQSRWFRG
jgi:hypothetical protein